MRKITLDEIGAWTSRTMVAILMYLGIEMRSDIKVVKEKLPAIEEQIINLKEQTNRLQNKVFARVVYTAKKEEEINFENLIKMQP